MDEPLPLPLSDYTNNELSYHYNKAAHLFSEAAGRGDAIACVLHQRRLNELREEIVLRVERRVARYLNPYGKED